MNRGDDRRPGEGPGGEREEQALVVVRVKERSPGQADEGRERRPGEPPRRLDVRGAEAELPCHLAQHILPPGSHQARHHRLEGRLGGAGQGEQRPLGPVQAMARPEVDDAGHACPGTDARHSRT